MNFTTEEMQHLISTAHGFAHLENMSKNYVAVLLEQEKANENLAATKRSAEILKSALLNRAYRDNEIDGKNV